MMRLNKIITLTFFYLFLGCSQTVAWGRTINGKIIDDKQLPIDGATIILQTMDSTYIGASISAIVFITIEQPKLIRNIRV